MNGDLAIGLLTCDRDEYTQRTLQTLAEHNDLKMFGKYHADDASHTVANNVLARHYGFKTLGGAGVKLGATAKKRHLIQAAKADGFGWLLLLENDWESVRPFPWDLYVACASSLNVYCLRMYGKYKEANDTRPAGATHAGKNNSDPNWQALPFLTKENQAPYMAEIGDIHWAAPPSVTKIDVLEQLFDGAKHDRDVRMKSGLLTRYTVRPVENIMNHIGVETTPNFRH